MHEDKRCIPGGATTHQWPLLGSRHWGQANNMMHCICLSMLSLMARTLDSQSEKVDSNLACALKQGILSHSLHLWDRDVNVGCISRK